MTAPLQACLDFTMSYEGGWSDNPKDPGGATIYGITLATFRTVRKNIKLGVRQLRALTKAQAEAIYSNSYYIPVRADMLPPGLDVMAGDMAVNAGVKQSSLLLQRALGVTADGAIGPETVAAAQSCNLIETVGKLGKLQQQFYQDLTLFPVFGKGWLARVEARTTTALNMVQS